MAEDTNITEYFSTDAGIFELFLGVLVPPIVWWLDQEAMASMVHFACPDHWRLPFHLISLIGFLVAAGSGMVAWRNWQRLGARWPGEEGGIIARSQFMAIIGILSGAVFFLVMLGQFIAGFFLGPCV